MSTLAASIQLSAKITVNKSNQKTRRKRNISHSGRMKLALYTDDMILSVEKETRGHNGDREISSICGTDKPRLLQEEE